MSSALSRPCVTCYRRRIQCDKAFGGCLNCRKEGWKCIGYPEAWQHRQSRRTSSTIVTSSNTSVKMIPVGTVDSLRAQLVSHLTNAPSSAIAAFLASRGFLHHLPARVGLNDALDDAVRCICSVSCVNLDKPAEELQRMQRATYSTALQSVSASLGTSAGPNSPRYTVELLIAVILLQMFEQSTNLQAKQWIRHAGGATRLIEVMGPDFIVDELSAEIMLSHMGRITFECLRQGQESFLGKDRWQAVFPRCAGLINRRIEPEKLNIADNMEYHRITSLFPHLFHRYRTSCRRKAMLRRTQYGLNATNRGQQYSNQGISTRGPDPEDSLLQQSLMDFRYQMKNYRAMVVTNPPSLLPSSDKYPQNRMQTSTDFGTASFLLFASYILLELRRYDASTFADLSDGERTTLSRWSQMANIEIEGLRIECIDLARIAINAHNRLRRLSPMASKLMGQSMAEVWTNITKMSLDIVLKSEASQGRDFFQYFATEIQKDGPIS